MHQNTSYLHKRSRKFLALSLHFLDGTGTPPYSLSAPSL